LAFINTIATRQQISEASAAQNASTKTIAGAPVATRRCAGASASIVDDAPGHGTTSFEAAKSPEQ
jgi:hypothetical protein